VIQAGKGDQEQGVLEPMVPKRLASLAWIEVPEWHGVGPRPAKAANWPGVRKRAIEPIAAAMRARGED
jgi:hypothetical protein